MNAKNQTVKYPALSREIPPEAMNRATATNLRPPQVEEHLEILQKGTCELGNAINELITRVNCVLRQQPSTDSKEGPQETLSVPLACKLADVHNQLRRMNTSVQDAISRIEV